MPDAAHAGRALTASRAAPADMKRRLLHLIEACDPYWVLTGSDPDAVGAVIIIMALAQKRLGGRA